MDITLPPKKAYRDSSNATIKGWMTTMKEVARAIRAMT